MAKYNLYVAGECIAEHNNFDKARKEFYDTVKEHPDCDIDIMDESCEYSLLAYDSNTEQVYNYQ